jgi:dihydrofolate synthase/folylpolyglutamate synthase
MGGRLDATNIVDPLLSVITDISLDHTEWLGPTIAAIAREKAGILRPNGTLVTLPQHPEANQAIGEIAAELNVRGVSAVPCMPATEAESQQDTYHIHALGTSIEIASPLHGAHQHRNIALAIAAAIELGFRHGVPITPEAIASGIRNTRWPGRLEIIATPSATGRPIEWILDVAHNPAGAWALRASLSSLERRHGPAAKPSVLIFSCLRDKPVNELAQILFPLFDRVIFAPIHSARATPMPDLLAAAAATGTPATIAASIAEALALAEAHSSTDVILSDRSKAKEVEGPASPNAVEGYGLQPVHTPTTHTDVILSDRSEAKEVEGPASTDVILSDRSKAKEVEGPASHLRIVVSGSVYLVGEARPLLLARAASPVGNRSEVSA